MESVDGDGGGAATPDPLTLLQKSGRGEDGAKAPKTDGADGRKKRTVDDLLRRATRPQPTSRLQGALASRVTVAGGVFVVMAAVFLVARPSFVTTVDEETGLHKVRVHLVVAWAALAAVFAAVVPAWLEWPAAQRAAQHIK